MLGIFQFVRMAVVASMPMVDVMDVPGVVVETQTCDIVRPSQVRPAIQIAPLVAVDDDLLTEVRRRRRPAFAYIPGAAHENLVADLDRSMTVDKAIVAKWSRTPGCRRPR